MITRRRALAGLGAAALATPWLTLSQEPRKRITYLANNANATNSKSYIAFKDELRKLGWTDENLTINIRVRENKDKDPSFDPVAAAAIRANDDVIVTTGSASTLAAKRATTTIPIVFGSALDPVGQGFVASYSRPGGNITGVALENREPRRLQRLKELLPDAVSIGRLFDPGSIGKARQDAMMHELDAAARNLGVKLHYLPVGNRTAIESAIRGARKDGIAGLILTAPPLFVGEEVRKWMADIALEMKMPTMCAEERFVRAGALASYGESYPANYRQAASIVNKILRGAKPADIPVEKPNGSELMFNPRTLKALNLELPRTWVDAVPV